MAEIHGTVMFQDPVCGRNINEGEGQEILWEGETFRFCSQSCMLKFLEQARLQDAESESPKEGPPSAITLNIPIQGMTCASCVRTVETAIKEIPGIYNVQVNFGTRTALVRLDPDKVRTGDIKSRVENSGYEVPDETTLFHVSADADPSMLQRATENIPHIPGVLEVESRIIDRVIRVRYLAGSVTPGEILHILRDYGITAESESRIKAADTQKQELFRYLYRFLLALTLSIPIHVLSHSSIFTVPVRGFILFVLATPVEFVAGWPFLRGAWLTGLHRRADMNTLVAVGTLSAFLYSLAATLMPAWWIRAGLPVMFYYDTSSAIITLILMGRVLELQARNRTNTAIRKLMSLQPEVARVLRDGMEYEIPVDEVHPGDLVLLKPGDRVPVDGIVREGTGSIDTSVMTGESVPVDVSPGSELLSGTTNLNGRVVFEAVQVGESTLLKQIIRFVQQAQASRAPIQRLADAISAVFVPIVIIIAILTAVAWALLGPPPAITQALISMVSVLIIACPCALGLATPTAVIVGIGRAASLGILIKSAETLEALARVSLVVLDKTGTLTTGKPQLRAVHSLGTFTEDQLLRWGAAAEQGSEHPFGKALVEAAKGKNLELPIPEQFTADPGSGIHAIVEGVSVLLKKNERSSSEHPFLSYCNNQGWSVVEMHIHGRLEGFFAFSDIVRPDATPTLEQLRHLGLKTVLLTGDDLTISQRVAVALNFDEFYARVLPQEKASIIQKLQARNEKVAMMGDGINDAPALVQADVGIAVKKGTDIAMDSAGVVLMHDRLSLVPTSLHLARATLSTIKQNLFLSFIYNVAAIPLAAGIFYPWTGWRLHPTIAATAMALSSVSVVSNALRLKRRKLIGSEAEVYRES